MIRVPEGAVRLPVVTQLQKAAARLPHAMAAYVRWLGAQPWEGFRDRSYTGRRQKRQRGQR